MPTVEAVQVRLLGREGIILWPVDETYGLHLPPEFINDEDLAKYEGRVFPHHNPHGPVYEYERSIVAMRWRLVRTIRPKGGE